MNRDVQRGGVRAHDEEQTTRIFSLDPFFFFLRARVRRPDPSLRGCARVCETELCHSQRTPFLYRTFHC